MLIFCFINDILFPHRRRLDALNYARKLVQGELTEEDLDDPLGVAAEVYCLILMSLFTFVRTRNLLCTCALLLNSVQICFLLFAVLC